MREQTTTRPRFSVDHWAAFWADPGAAKNGHAVLASDIVGYWPGQSQPIRGRRDYSAKITELLQLMPDLRLEVVDSATNGDLIFIHYLGRATGPSGPIEFRGIDRIRVRDGIVVENVIRYDTEMVHAALTT